MTYYFTTQTMYVIYAKDEDDKIACSDRYQETELLGVYSTLELAKQQIESHKLCIQKRLEQKRLENTRKLIPRTWNYYIYSCVLDQPIILDEDNALSQN